MFIKILKITPKNFKKYFSVFHTSLNFFYNFEMQFWAAFNEKYVEKHYKEAHTEQ